MTMKDRTNNTNAKSEYTPDPVRSSRHGGFKKRSSSNNNSLNNEAGNFKGLGFRIGKDGPKVYEKTIDKLSLYTSKQFNNGSDLVMCLRAEEYVDMEVPIMPQNPSENDKYVWEYEMSDYLKSKKVLKENLRSLYTIIMSLCDTEVKNQVRALEGYMNSTKSLIR